MIRSRLPSIDKSHSKIDLIDEVITKSYDENIRNLLPLHRSLRLQLKQAYSFRSIASTKRSSKGSSLPKHNLNLSKLLDSNQSSFASFLLKNDSNASIKKSVSPQKDHIHIVSHQQSKMFSPDQLREQFMKLCGSKMKDHNFGNIRLRRSKVRAFLNHRYGERLSERLLNFYEVPNQMDFKSYLNFREVIENTTPLMWCYIYFHNYDFNEDKLICNTDLFKTYMTVSEELQDVVGQDLLSIYRYASTRLNSVQHSPNQMLVMSRSALMLQPHMTITQFRHSITTRGTIIGPKVEVKRNTIFLNNFGALDFFAQQDMHLLDAFKDLGLEKKPFKFSPEEAFSINFLHFQEIFTKEAPQLFQDLINYLAMNETPQMSVPQNDFKEFIQNLKPPQNIIQEGKVLDSRQYKRVISRLRYDHDKFFE